MQGRCCAAPAFVPGSDCISRDADHVYQLLEEYFGDEKLYSHLITAYCIGWGTTYEEAERVPQMVPTIGEDDVDCVITYDAEAPEVEDTIITPWGERNFAINSLNWRTDSTPADKVQNKGAVFVKNSLKAKEVPQFCGAVYRPCQGVFEGDGCRSLRV